MTRFSSHYDREEPITLAGALSALPVVGGGTSLLRVSSEPPEQQAAVQKIATSEFSAVNALIHARGAKWSKKARAIKFDIEFQSIEHERRRVAKELHDEILPSLARLIRSVEACSQDGSGNAIVDELHVTVAAFRDLLGQLHPVDLEELGLVAALSNLCQRYVRFTGRSIAFVEQSEECNLSELQQLSLYRAMQTALKLFADSDNDILLVNYNRVDSKSVVTLRCADKTVPGMQWLSTEEHDFDAFKSWCATAGAELHIGSRKRDYDLMIAASEAEPLKDDISTLIGELTQVRLQELDAIVAMAQEEWAQLINRDCTLFKNLAIETERRRIADDINHFVVPHLGNVMLLADRSADDSIRGQVMLRMQVTITGVNRVIADTHPRLLEETGFIGSVRSLIDRFRRASLIQTVLISPLPQNELDELSLDVKFAIYRVIQEALNNIEKHSAASRALVAVKPCDDRLVICIEDNGKGFRETRSTLSRGLRNIRERASAIGATVTWDQARSFPTGTLVTIDLQCDQIARHGKTEAQS